MTVGYQAIAPYSGTIVDLLTGEVVKETLGIAVKHAKEKSEDQKGCRCICQDCLQLDRD